jgi:transposase
MHTRLLHLHFQTYDKLRRLKKEAEADGAHRVAKRIHAITLNHDGLSSGAIAELLDAPRSKVSQWLSDYEHFGYEALLEGQRPGRPGQLTKPQQVQLEDIIDSGPQAWGFLSGVWSAPMVGRIISEEFGIGSRLATSGGCCTSGAFRCNGPGASLCAPIHGHKIDGGATRIPA